MGMRSGKPRTRALAVWPAVIPLLGWPSAGCADRSTVDTAGAPGTGSVTSAGAPPVDTAGAPGTGPAPSAGASSPARPHAAAPDCRRARRSLEPRQLVEEARALYPPSGSAEALLRAAEHGPGEIVEDAPGCPPSASVSDHGFGTKRAVARREAVGARCLTEMLSYEDRPFLVRTTCTWAELAKPDPCCARGPAPEPPLDPVASALSAETLAAGRRIPNGIVFEHADAATRAEARRAVAPELGPVPAVTVPPALREAHSVLTDELRTTEVGSFCGLGGALLAGRKAIDDLVEAGRMDLVRDVARSLNPGGRVFAAMALWQLSSSRADDLLVRRIRDLGIGVSTCSGCIGGESTAADIFSRAGLWPPAAASGAPGAGSTDGLPCDGASGVRITPPEMFGLLAIAVRTGSDDYRVEYVGGGRVWMASSAGRRCVLPIGGEARWQRAERRAERVFEVHRISDTHVAAGRTIVAPFLAELRRSAVRGAFEEDRVSGGPAGIRLFGVGSSPILRSLGLEEGDRLRSINGLVLDDPLREQKACSVLQQADHVTMSFLRAGQSRLLQIDIE